MTNKHEGEGACHHETSTEEAIHRVAMTMETLQAEYSTTKFYHFKKRVYIKGMMMAFSMVLAMLTALADKYDNTRGTLN